MKTARTTSLLIVTDESALTRESLSNAVSLIGAVSDECYALGSTSDLASLGSSLKISKLTANPLDGRGTDQIQQCLDQFELDQSVLVVCIGSTHPVVNYLAQRVKREQCKDSSWEVVSSNFSRFSFLDSHRSLSSFIPIDTLQWLRKLVSDFGEDQILFAPERLRGLDVGILGETIIDRYIICQALGKVSKDPLIAFEEQSSQEQFGGILAIARHLSGCGVRTTVFTELQQHDKDRFGTLSEVDFSRSMAVSHRPLVKTRFVDRATSARVFETYQYGIPEHESHSRRSFERSVADWKRPLIIADYGHGLIDDSLLGIINSRRDKTAVNTQSNAGNRGFNPISRYSGAALTFLNGGEVEVETRKRAIDLRELVGKLAVEILTDEFYVTNGALGIVVWNQGQCRNIPAFAPSIVDRTGAGDALLATVSAMRFADVPIEIATFYGNIAGAIMCGALGNSVGLTSEILRHEADKLIRHAVA